MNMSNVDDLNAQGNGQLRNKVALIVGGDSGLGLAVASAFAKQEADVAIVYHLAREDAHHTKQMVEAEGRSCLLIAGNVGEEKFCQQAVQQTIERFGKIDILVNNATERYLQQSNENISTEEMERILYSNLCPMFYLTNAALPYLKEGSTIINTTSVRVYKGNEQLLDYSSTRGAIVTFTRSLSQSLKEKGIRVNGVVPGPVWTMLVPCNLPADKVKALGEQMPNKGASSPAEIAQSIVFLASDDAFYRAGQVLFTQSLPA
ncbi:MAG TPA: NAD(P)-dependent oxidoreductase [Cyanobacteria bacterium UBA8543]|nr:NAD(P)-dependent oxidoreductase [Cyanobacteria bacterium UBA8543]